MINSLDNRNIQVAQNYADAILHRVTRPLQPENFEPDWVDQPSRHKIYHQVERFPLSLELPKRIASMADILDRLSVPQATTGTLTFEELTTILLLSHGVLARRIGVNWNHDDYLRARYWGASYSRGTASGGGMYPTEIYWSCGPSGPLLPGIYHYDNAHNAMERLLTGDVTSRVRAAVFQHADALAADQFLIITLNFWKNAFKYNNFCYHVVTQDVGALLSSLRLLATGFGIDLSFLTWFQDEALNQLLGLNTRSESAFVVIPLPGQRDSEQVASAPGMYHLQAPRVDKACFQRSRKLLTFDMVENMHLSSLVKDELRPKPILALKASYTRYETSGQRIELPAPALASLQDDISVVFKRRQSSFGRFSNHKPLSAAELGTLLSFGSAVRNYGTDLRYSDGSSPFTRLLVFVNHVQNIKPGAYAYDSQNHCLWTIQQGEFAQFLQKHYFLQNYNMEQTGAVVTIAGKVNSMLEVYGNRGYRFLNAEVGMVAQALYLASTALSLACGAILGFDNAAYNEALHLHEADERTILTLLIGHQSQGNSGFDLPIIV